MLERILFALALGGIALMAWCVYNRACLRRLAAQAIVDPALMAAPRGTPVIVYFTTPFCATCRTQQQPALQAIASQFGADIHIVQIDATQQPEAATRWGVFSAPTTFVLDAAFQPRFVNRGVATQEMLCDQLAKLA
jgi:thiol-disulfide isomerase/thioredoxin